MNLTEHFTLEELYQSSTALRLGINNKPPLDIIKNLKVAASGMEAVRMILQDNPIHVDSGYRCPLLNVAVGGSKESAHMQGYAVDFVCPAFGTPEEIVEQIRKSKLPVDKIIAEGNWVHASFDPRLRGIYLRALFDPKGNADYRALP